MANYPIYQIGSFVLDETNGIYVQSADPDSSTPMSLDVQEVARRSGGKIVSATLASKRIPLKGIVVGSSWSDLNLKLDALKAAVVGTNLSLDVDDGVSCRRFSVATDGSATANRDNKPFHADFAVTFRAADPPFGQEALRGGALVTTTALNDTNVTLDIYTPNPLAFLGTAPPAAKATITVTTGGDLTSLEFVDVTNGRSLAVTPAAAIATGDVIVIDGSVPSVTLNNQAVAFTGVFPSFQPSSSSQVAVYAYTSTGLILDQSQNLGNTQQLLYATTQVVAQKWTTGSTAGPMSRFQFQASKVGSPTGSITVTVKADNGSGTAPSGAALATATVLPAQVAATIQKITANMAALPTLSASTLYWVLLTVGSGCDLNNYYLIRSYSNTPKGYAAGQAYLSANSGSSYSAVASSDLAFRTYRSVQGAKNDVPDAGATNLYSENFSTTTKKDAGNTTADWNTSGPYLTMLGSTFTTAQQGQSLELASTVADILSVSQVTTTLFVGGSFAGTYQGAASADNGTTFSNIARDAAAFDTENIPSVIGSQLKMRWTLQNLTTAVRPYVSGTALYWRKGISLDASTKRGAQLFTQLASGVLARVDLYVRKVGSPGDLTVDVYGDTAGSPGSLLGTATVTASGVAAGVWGWVPGNLASTFSVTASTSYWIVPRCAASVDNSNKWLVLANNNGYAGASKRSSNSGSSWSAITSSEKLLFRTYGVAGNNFAYNVRIDYVKAYL